MKHQVLERVTNACFTSVFLISFILFGSLIERGCTIKSYLAIATLPVASYALSELLLTSIYKKNAKLAASKGKVQKKIILTLTNSLLICGCIFHILKYANHGQVSAWQFVFLSAFVLWLQMFLNAFWVLMYQKHQLETELDRVAHIIQANNSSTQDGSETKNAISNEIGIVSSNGGILSEKTLYMSDNQLFTPPHCG